MPNGVSFVLLREGTSDEGLVGHLRELLVRAGAPEAVGEARDVKGTVAQKLASLKHEDRPADVVFCHRDANSKGPRSRRVEIESAVAEVGIGVAVIPIIPVRSLEAWLLTDQMAIREVVGRPQGRYELSIPPLSRIESLASPKDTLFQAFRDAETGVPKRRRSATVRDLVAYRATLLQRLDLDGPVNHLPSWRALLQDIDRWLAAPAQWRS